MGIDTDTIERYQRIFEKNPKSQIFAPLADAYRHLGLFPKALELAEQGVKSHPHFPSGYMVLAKVYLDQGETDLAVKALKKLIQLSPENIQAHQSLAQTYAKAQKPLLALKSFKMLLFLDPQNEYAQKQVKRLESITASDYEADLFDMIPPQNLEATEAFSLSSSVPAATPDDAPDAPPTPPAKRTFYCTLERFLSLADAYIVRSDLPQAAKTLALLEEQIGPHKEIDKRRRFLEKVQGSLSETSPHQTEEPVIALSPAPQPNKKLLLLESLLKRIESRRKDPADKNSP